MRRFSVFVTHSLSIGLIALLAFTADLPASADEPQRGAKVAGKPIDFAHDVAPIIQKRCAKCHTGTQKKGGLSFNTRQSLLAGGDGGASVVPKKSAESDLVERVSAKEADLRMPPEGERLTAEQIDLLKRWIDADLPWEDGFAFGKSTRQAPITPRRPAIPDVAGANAPTNPVDRFLHGYFFQHKLPSRTTVSDRVFARRVSFDLVGLPPSPADLAALESDTAGTKRARFVEHLLADREAYTAHWLTFWNDLLRNAYHGTGFIDGGRKQITGWLYGAIYENEPYDRFVHELVSPSRRSGAEGFTFGTSGAALLTKASDAKSRRPSRSRRYSWGRISSAPVVTTVSSITGNSPTRTPWPRSSPMGSSNCIAATSPKACLRRWGSSIRNWGRLIPQRRATRG